MSTKNRYIEETSFWENEDETIENGDIKFKQTRIHNDGMINISWKPTQQEDKENGMTR